MSVFILKERHGFWFIMTKLISEYNKEPVFYCRRCHSLRIMRIKNTDMDYCDCCGSVDIAETTIEEWVKIKQKQKKDGREANQ